MLATPTLQKMKRPIESTELVGQQFYPVRHSTSTYFVRMDETPIMDDVEGDASESGGDFGDFMKSIEESMVHMMKESSNAPQTALDHWNAFSSAVDWSENWIRGLLVFHVVLLCLVVATRKNLDLQTFFFAVVCVLVFCSERLNGYCAQNWSQFAKQNYFDAHGVFAGIMYSGPLLLIGLFQLLNFLALSSSALIKAKKLELAHKKKSGDSKVDKQEQSNDSDTKKSQ